MIMGEKEWWERDGWWKDEETGLARFNEDGSAEEVSASSQLEPLLTPDALKGEQFHQWMLRWQGQWQADRPDHVMYLRRKGKLREALRNQSLRAKQHLDQLWDQGVEYREAVSEAESKFLAMPTPLDQPSLPKELAPYGQPKRGSALNPGDEPWKE